jgi:L-ribulose-5-phosphate 4-epimerase
MPNKTMTQTIPSEGYLKFDCHLTKEAIQIPSALYIPLNQWRNELWQRQLIGSYPDGIGYGNISIRVPKSSQFYISGTATGGIPELDQTHYPLVERCDPALNTLWCRGLIRASAESMSHAAVYGADPDIGAVVHIHNRELWEKYLEVLPTTDRNVEYGTPGMAYEISRMMTLPEVLERKIFVMGGHEEGIIAFGKTIEEASMVILEIVKN